MCLIQRLCGILVVGCIAVTTQPKLTVAANNTTKTLRIATFNVSLYGKQAGEIRGRLSDRNDLQAKRIASIVQTVRPDILLINELDYESDSAPAKLLAENYFAVAQDAIDDQGKLQPIEYPSMFSAPSNTGIDSGIDLNRDGRLGTPSDAWGYGVYSGQYSMAVYSRFPIDASAVRSFQQFKWSAMPGAILPVDPATQKPYYDDATWAKLRLSSKNHIDVPIQIGDQTLHLLASHPTPPVFDGPEDRNGARNHDEIEFWNHYIDDSDQSNSWLVDDAGKHGGLESNARFVIAGDLNADPVDGSGRREAIQKLLARRRTIDVAPQRSGGGAEGTKTADFGRNGFMRVDFVIPSDQLNVIDSGIFWPAETDPKVDWIKATDHRLVWIDIEP